MSVTTHLPTDTYAGGHVAVTGGATAHAVLADASDATYVRRSEAGTPMLSVVCSQIPGPLSGSEALYAVRPAIRAKKVTSGQAVSLGSELRGVDFSSVRSVTPANTIVDLYGDPIPTPGSTAFEPDLHINDPDVQGISASAYVYKAWFSAYYIPLATCAAVVVDTDETGSPIEGTQTPRFDIDASAVVEAWQVAAGFTDSLTGRVQARLFASAVYGAGGFDPSTSEDYLQEETVELGSEWSTYTDGTTPAVAALELTLPEAIPATGTFRLYVRAQRGPAPTFWGTVPWGAWSYVEFVMDAHPAATPTITATTGAIEVEVDVTPVEVAAHTDPLITVERSIDDGATWTRLRDASWVPGAYGLTATFVDYEAPRGVALTYRAKVRDSVGTGTVESEWASDTTTARAIDGWNLKPLAFPASNIYGLNVVGRPSRKRTDDVARHYPKGRSYPVTVFGGSFGYSGSLEVVCENQTQIDALEAALAHHVPMLLEDGYGASMWIWVSEPEHTLLGTTTAPARRYTLAYAETARPTG